MTEQMEQLHHTVVAESETMGEVDITKERLRVKMKTQGTKILFEPKAPTGEELQDCPHI